MSSSAVYSVDWVATFLHEFPHVNFSFQLTNSTFDPDNPSYREVSTLFFLPLLHAVTCIRLLSAGSWYCHGLSPPHVTLREYLSTESEGPSNQHSHLKNGALH